MVGSSPSPAREPTPRSVRENMVARMPALYIEVPRTMSFSVWPVTLRQNRRTAFELMPVGRLLASTRWVASRNMIPAAGPRLPRSVTIPTSSGSSSNATWTSSTTTTTGHRPRSRRSASARVTLPLPAYLAGQGPDGLVAAGHLLGEVADVGLQVGQVVGVVAGPEPVRHRLQRQQVRAAAEVVDVQLGGRVQRGRK